MNDQPNTPNPVQSRSEKVRVWLQAFGPYVVVAGSLVKMIFER